MVAGPQWLPPVTDATISSGMQLALACTLLLNWLLRKRMSLRYAVLPHTNHHLSLVQTPTAQGPCPVRTISAT